MFFRKCISVMVGQKHFILFLIWGALAMPPPTVTRTLRLLILPLTLTVRNFHSLKGNTEAGRALKLFCATAVQHLQMCVC